MIRKRRTDLELNDENIKLFLLIIGDGASRKGALESIRKIREDQIKKLLNDPSLDNLAKTRISKLPIQALSRSQLYEWIRRGKEGQPVYRNFIEDLARAEADGAVNCIKRLVRIGEKDHKFNKLTDKYLLSRGLWTGSLDLGERPTDNDLKKFHAHFLSVRMKVYGLETNIEDL